MPSKKDTMRTRNLRVAKVAVSDLLEHPSNPRTHNDDQRKALEDTMNQIGWYGFPIVYERNGKYQLIDGHLRLSVLKKQRVKYIEVLVTDFKSKHAKMALLTHDALSAYATTDKAMLKGILESIELEASTLRSFLEDDLPMISEPLVDGEENTDAVDPYDGMGGYDDEPETCRCPECDHEWTL